MKNFRRVTALLLACLICAGAVSALAINAFASSSELKKGEFRYAPHTYTDGDLTDIYYYSDNFFSGDATEYNAHLATMSMILAAASISSQEIGIEYDIKSQNLAYLLRDLEFTGFEVNDYYTQKPGEQTMGVAMAYRIIGEGENAYTLLAIIPRSAGYEKEWAGNFTVGKDGLHQGFATGRDIILEFAKEYVEENKESFEGEVKVWTVGYSRGAGVANLLAAYLDDNSSALGVEVTKENIFAYTFGTPSNVQYSSEAEKKALEDNYKNIHNRYSEYDIVTYVPFKNWNFAYYGTTKLFDVNNAEKKAEMLSFLEKTNKTIYDLYTAQGSSADPDNFTPVMVEINLANGIVPGIVAADPAYGIPANQKDFLDSRIDFLVENLVPNREAYVDGGYEYALQRFTSLYFGLNAEQSAKLFGGMSHDIMTLAAAYYCYFLSEFYLDTEKGTATVNAIAESLLMVEQYIELLGDSPEVSSAEWYIYAKAFIESDKYAEIEAILDAISKDASLIEGNIEMIKATVKSLAVGMTSKVLGSGVNALDMEEEEKQKLLATMTDESVAAPLTEFFVYLLLGSEEETIAPFDPGNKNVALAVTFVYNAGRYMRVHNNEIILSWLRTEDSYYSDEQWHIHEFNTMYDEIGHWEECACGYGEEKYQHSLSEWRELEVEEGEKKVLVRSCPCGYEETKEDMSVDKSKDKKFSLDSNSIIVLSAGGAAIVFGAVAMAIVMNKRKRTK